MHAWCFARPATLSSKNDRSHPVPNEVLVRVTAVGVCGSDVHYVKHGRIGNFVVTGPMILGTNRQCVIVAVGSQYHPIG